MTTTNTNPTSLSKNGETRGVSGLERNNEARNKKRKRKNFFMLWDEYSGKDLVYLMAMGLVGIALPKFILDETAAWKHLHIPGQRANLTFVEPATNITFSTEVFLKDPEYSKEHTADDSETVSTNLLFAFSGLIPMIYVPIFLICLSKISVKYSKNKKFLQRWDMIWFECISFLYGYVIAMSLTFWVVKSLKVLVSWPRPDFYDRCGMDASNLDNIVCISEARDEILKSFKSFPSGHSANLFTSGIVLVYYTWNKLNILEPMKIHKFHHTWYIRHFFDFVLLWPVFLAAWVAATRIKDHLHTPSDILGGACIGYAAARMGYFSQYKQGSPWSYRLLLWPEIRQQIRDNSTLQKLMYPKLFAKDRKELLMSMTKYDEKDKITSQENNKNNENKSNNNKNKQLNRNYNTDSNNNDNKNDREAKKENASKETEMTEMMKKNVR